MRNETFLLLNTEDTPKPQEVNRLRSVEAENRFSISASRKEFDHGTLDFSLTKFTYTIKL